MAPRSYSLDAAAGYVAQLTTYGSGKLSHRDDAVIAIRRGFGTTGSKAKEILYDAVGAGKLLMFQVTINGSYLSQLKLNTTGSEHRFMWVAPEEFPDHDCGHHLHDGGLFQTKRPDAPAKDGSRWVILPEPWKVLSERLLAEFAAQRKAARESSRAKKAQLQERHGEDLRYIAGLLTAAGIPADEGRLFAYVGGDSNAIMSVDLRNEQITSLAEVLKGAGIAPVDWKG